MVPASWLLDLDQVNPYVRPESWERGSASSRVLAMKNPLRILLAVLVAAASLGAISERVRDQGVTDTEIRIGNLMPYSGSLEIFGAIGKAEAAYFDVINERGGI